MIISEKLKKEKKILGLLIGFFKENNFTLKEAAILHTISEIYKENENTNVTLNKKTFMRFDIESFLKDYDFFMLTENKVEKILIKFAKLGIIETANKFYPLSNKEEFFISFKEVA